MSLSPTTQPSLAFSTTRPAGRPSSPSAAPEVPIIAFCHLSWRGVWQRPQQLLSRLALRHPVLFVETHCRDVAESAAHAYVAPGHPRVTILEMHLPSTRWQDGAYIDGERRRL
jgi:hypothetical protein